MEENLEIVWHFQREGIVRNNLKTIWSTVDSNLTVLNAGVAPPLIPRRDMCNKPTALYFEQSAQYGRYDGLYGYPCIQRIFITAIYEAWRTRCGETLDIEFGHFLANPVRITKQGPQSLSEIVTAHRNTCNLAKEYGLGGDEHKVQKSYPAVILVVVRKAEGSATDEDGLVNLRRVTEQLTVLVIRTDASLTFTLDSLEPHTLPLERSDAHGLDVRRVLLVVAVDFIVSLEGRTSEATKWTTKKYDNNLSCHEVPKGFDQSARNDPRTWVAALMAACTEKGPGCMTNIQEALQRLEGHTSGELCDVGLEHDEWSHRWKSGYGATA